MKYQLVFKGKGNQVVLGNLSRRISNSMERFMRDNHIRSYELLIFDFEYLREKEEKEWYEYDDIFNYHGPIIEQCEVLVYDENCQLIQTIDIYDIKATSDIVEIDELEDRQIKFLCQEEYQNEKIFTAEFETPAEGFDVSKFSLNYKEISDLTSLVTEFYYDGQPIVLNPGKKGKVSYYVEIIKEEDED